MAYIDHTFSIQKRIDTIWYVSSYKGNDNNDGKSPDRAFATISKALSVASSSDTIIIGGGVYNEALNITSDKYGLIIIGDGKVFVDATTFTSPALTLQSNYNRIENIVFSSPSEVPSAIVSGNYNVFKDVTVNGGTYLDLLGFGNVFEMVHIKGYSQYGIKVSGDRNDFLKCVTMGTSSDLIGYYITSNENHFCDIVSVNDTLYSMYISGVDNIAKSLSFHQSRPPYLESVRNFIGDLHFQNFLESNVIDLSAGNTFNLFKIEGSIRVLDLFGVVEEDLGSDVGNVWFDTYDGVNTVNLSSTTGADASGYLAGALLWKRQAHNKSLTLENANRVRKVEFDEYSLRDFVLVTSEDRDTYIRFLRDGGSTTGKIKFYIRYIPFGRFGYIKTV